MAVRASEEFAVGIKADDQFTPEVKKAGEASEKTSKSITGLAGSVISLNQALELAGKAWTFVKATVGSSIDAFKEADKIQGKLAASLAANGQYTKSAMKGWQNYAEQIQATSTLDDDQVTGLVAKAKAMRLSDATTKKLIQTSIDMAGVFDGDVNQSFQQLAGTLNGVVGKSLTQADGRLKGLSEEQIKNGKAIELLGARYKGFGAVAANSIEGLELQAKNALGNLFEEIGRTLDQAFDFRSMMRGAKETFNELQDLVKSIAPTFIEVGREVKAFFTAFSETAKQVDWSAIAENMQVVIVALGGFAAISLAPMVASVAALAAEFLAIGAAIVAAVAAVDIMFRNLDKLPQVAKLFGAVFKLAINEVQLAIEYLFVFLFGEITKLLQSLGQALPKLVPALVPITQGMAKASEMLVDVIQVGERQLEGLKKEVGNASKGLDLGLAGALMDAGKQFFGFFGKNLDAAREKAKQVGSAMTPKNVPQTDDILGPLGKNAEALDEIMKKAMEARTAFEQIGMSANDIIDSNLKKQLAEVDALEQKLLIEKQLDALAKAKLDAARTAFTDKAEGEKDKNKDKSIKEMIIQGMKVGVAFMKEMLSGDLVEGFAGFLEQIENLPDAMLKAFEHLDRIIMSFMDKFPAALNKFLEKLPTIIDNFVKQFPKIIDMLVAGFPKFVDAIADAIPKIIRALAEAMPKIITVLGKAIERLIEMLPEVVDAIFDNLPEMIQAFFKAVPGIIKAILKALPEIVENIADNMDEIVLAFVQGIIEAMGEIVGAFVDFLIGGGLERIVGALLRMIPRIVVAFVQGVARGLANVFKRAFGIKINVPKGLSDIPEGIQKAADKLKAAFDKSKLFQVSDLVEAAKGGAQDVIKKLEDLIAEAQLAGQSIWDAFIEALKKGWDWLKKLGGKIWEGLKEMAGDVWAWFKDKGGAIWNGFVTAVKDILAFFGQLGTAIWNGFSQAVKDIGIFFSDLGRKIWEGLTTAVKDVGAWFVEMGGKIWTGFTTLLKDPGQWFKDRGGEIWTGLSSAITAGVQKLTDAGKSLWDGAMGRIKDWPDTIKGVGISIWDGVMARIGDWPNKIKGVGQSIWDGAMSRIDDWPNKIKGVGAAMCDGFLDALYDAWDWLVDFFGSLLPTGGGGGGGGGVLGTGIGFAGGVVKAARRVAGGTIGSLPAVDFTPQGRDRIPILGEEGEMMIRKEAVSKNLGLLSTINSGGSPGLGSGVTIERLEINVRSDVEGDAVRTKIWPEIEKKLRQVTQDGRFVIAGTGVR